MKIQVPKTAIVNKIIGYVNYNGSYNSPVTGTLYVIENLGPNDKTKDNHSSVLIEVNVNDVTKYKIGDVINIELIEPYTEENRPI